MVYFLPLLFLLIAPLVLTVFYRRWPRLALFWLGLIGITLIVWFILLLSRLQLPLVFSSAAWTPSEIFPSSPSLSIDSSSWPFAMGLVTLLLAILITDVVRTYIPASEDETSLQVSWNSWVFCMLAAGFGLLAVVALNPLTLILGWASIDLLELSHRLIQQKSDRDTNLAISIFAIRGTGIFFVLLAVISMATQGSTLEYIDISPQTSFWLFLAAIIRLGVLPFSTPSNRVRPLALNLETAYSYFPAAAALALLARLASSPISPANPVFLLALSLIAGFLAGLKWLTTEGSQAGQSAWIGGMASLSIVSALVMQPAASQSWGLALLSFGGMLALYTAYHRVLKILLGITLIGLTALPITISWAGILIFHPASGSQFQQLSIIIFATLASIIQVFLLIGCARLIITSQPKSYGLERWIWLIYGWGLLILPLISLLLAWWGGLWAAVTQADLTPFEYFLPGLIVTLVSGLLLVLYWRGWRTPQWIITSVAWLTSPDWLIRTGQSAFRFFTRIIATIDLVLEGSGGILWTLLVITLLVTIMTQIFLQVNP